MTEVRRRLYQTPARQLSQVKFAITTATNTPSSPENAFFNSLPDAIMDGGLVLLQAGDDEFWFVRSPRSGSRGGHSLDAATAP